MAAPKMSRRQHRKMVRRATKVGRKPRRRQVRAAYANYASTEESDR